jgi:hypothetical protein
MTMWCNTQVTFSPGPASARSESELEVNPLNPSNLVGASKRFTDPRAYAFTMACYSSFDAGETWTEAAPLVLLGDPDPNLAWSGVSDPALAWDDAGNCYLAALPFPGPNSRFQTLGIAVYRSGDGGRTWSAPNFIHRSTADDKQWATSDRSPGSRFQGHVYLAWDDGSQLAFARTTDRGVSWRGVGNQPVGTPLAFDSFSPSISVLPDGTVAIFWIARNTIKGVFSTDGGDSFSAPAVVADGLTTLSVLPSPGGFPELPGGTFRVLTLPTSAAGTGRRLVVAWSDYREGAARIYYRSSADGGATWAGRVSGQPLLPSSLSGGDHHDFHPQLASTPEGAVGCAFYDFGAKWVGGPKLIDVMLATSHDGGATFTELERVTNRAWDPTVDAPLSHGDPRTTFIGDYFGLGTGPGALYPFWTDTRTGVQEIFCGKRMRTGPWNGTQFRGTVAAGSTHRWFTWGWPACWHVVWTVVATTPVVGAPQVRWRVQVERADGGHVTYHVAVTNLSGRDVDIEARFTIFAAD